jgi:hypothetical protein
MYDFRFNTVMDKKIELTKTSELAPGILKKKNRQTLSWLLKKENTVAF